MQDVSEHFRGSGFKVFARILDDAQAPKSGRYRRPAGGQRTFGDRMNCWAQSEGQPGLGYIFLPVPQARWQSTPMIGPPDPIANNLGPDRTEAIRSQLGLEIGDAAVLRRGRSRINSPNSPAWRGRKIGHELRLVDEDRLRVLLDRRLPDVRVERGARRRSTSRTIRSRCRKASSRRSTDAGPARRSRRSSTTSSATGSSYPRARSATTARTSCARPLRSRATDAEVLEERFGGMYRAFQYGAPPHGGIAPGIDRIVMLLAGEENLREVVAFPMNQRAEDLLWARLRWRRRSSCASSRSASSCRRSEGAPAGRGEVGGLSLVFERDAGQNGLYDQPEFAGDARGARKDRSVE